MKTINAPVKNGFNSAPDPLFDTIAKIAKQGAEDVMAFQRPFQEKYNELINASNEAWKIRHLMLKDYHEGKASAYNDAAHTIAMLALSCGSIVTLKETDYIIHAKAELKARDEKKAWLAENKDHYGSKADAADVETEEETD